MLSEMEDASVKLVYATGTRLSGGASFADCTTCERHRNCVGEDSRSGILTVALQQFEVPVGLCVGRVIHSARQLVAFTQGKF